MKLDHINKLKTNRGNINKIMSTGNPDNTELPYRSGNQTKYNGNRSGLKPKNDSADEPKSVGTVDLDIDD